MLGRCASRTISATLLVLSASCSPEKPQDSDTPAAVESVAAAPVVAAPSPQQDAASSAVVRFTEVADEAGLGDVRNHSGSAEQRFIVETISAGVAWLDADLDGWLDLFLTDGSHLESPPADAGNRLFRNEAGAKGHRRFRDITQETGLAHTGWAMGTAVGDIDADGDPDLYVTYWGADRFYRNDGGAAMPSFVHQADTGLDNESWGTSATFADLDNNGQLDLYVANYLHFDQDHPPAGGNWCAYKGLDAFCGPEGIAGESDRLFRNTGDGHFQDLSADTGIDGWAWPGLGVVAGDLDDDGDTDLYVANDSEPNLLFRNDGNWQFTELGTRTGVAYSETGLAQAGMGVDAGDWDNDGDLDLFVSNFSDDVNTLYANDGAAWFSDATNGANLGGTARPFLGWATAFFDYDLDGALDLFVANGHVYPQLRNYRAGLAYEQRNLLYHNQTGRFTEVGLSAGFTERAASRSAAVADYDNDGDPDLLVANLNAAPHLYRNDGGNQNNWVGLELVGVHSNREAIGARVWLYTQESVQTREIQRGHGFHSQFDHRLQFGMGDTGLVDSVIVRWPAGTRQIVRNLQPGRYTRIVETGETVMLPATASPAAVPVAETVQTTSQNPAASPSLPAVDPSWDAGRCRRTAGQFYEQGRYAEAVMFLERAIELEPASVRSYVNLALVLHAGLGEGAERVVRQALAIDGKRPEAWHLLGKVLWSDNRPQGALEAFAKAAGYAPQSGEYAGWLGLAQSRVGDNRGATASFHRATTLAPWDPRPHLNLARVHEKAGDAALASSQYAEFDRLAPAQSRLDHYRRKVEEYPDNATASLLLARAYEEQRRWAAAERGYRQALKLEEQLAEAHHGMGRILRQRGDLPAAVQALQRAAQLNSENTEVYNDLGQAYHFQRQYDRAIHAYQLGLARDGSLALVHGNLAMAYAMAGRLPESIESFRRSVELDSTAVESRDAMAQVLLASGDSLGAGRQWQKVVRQQPSHEGAAKGLTRLSASQRASLSP